MCNSVLSTGDNDAIATVKRTFLLSAFAKLQSAVGS